MVKKNKRRYVAPVPKTDDQDGAILPIGESLTDEKKRQWRLDWCIGNGSFGSIYLATDEIAFPQERGASHVAKIEVLKSKGLKREMSFYSNVDQNELDAWKQERKLQFLGVPQCYSWGSHVYQGSPLDFIVLKRFGKDLRKIIKENGNILPAKRVFLLGTTILNSLEYIHNKGFAHVDIKASNLVVGEEESRYDEVYLIDYGLSMNINIDGSHRKFQEKRRLKGPAGTCLFASRDAHVGCAFSRRADLEVVGYNMIEWISGHLPWEDFCKDCGTVRELKCKYMKDISLLIKDSFKSAEAPMGIAEYLSYIVNLDFEQRPDYSFCREILKSAIGAYE